MRFVVVTGHYPPSTEVGALRPAKVVQALIGAGHDVVVIRPPGADPDPAEGVRSEGRLTVRTVVPGSSPRTWYRDFKAAFQTDDDPATSAGPVEAADAWVPPATIGRLKRLVLSLMWLPDDQQGLVFPLARAATAAIREGGPGTVLYTTSPPHSVHLAGLYARLLTGARWIVEFRDPWSDNPAKPWFCRSAFSEGAERLLERLCLTLAVGVVAVSEGIERVVRPKLGRRHDRLILARNGIDQIVETPPPRPNGPFRIVHAGSFYLGRDPRPFLRSLATVSQRLRLTPADVKVELIGRSEFFDGISIPGVVADLGLTPLVEFVAWLPHREAAARIESADLLLLLAERQPLQVPNKLYEYLGTRRPMFVYADPDGESARMTREVGGHTVVHADDPGADAALERAIRDRTTASRGNLTLLREWSSERQMDRLVRGLERLLRYSADPPESGR